MISSCIPPANDIPVNPLLKDLKEETDLSETGSALPYFTTYVEAMNKSGLGGIFRKKGPYTIFMPRVEAFEKFFTSNQITGLEELSTEELEMILLYHIIPGKWMTYELKTGYYSSLARHKDTGNFLNLYIENEDILKINDEMAFGTSDIESDNGVIHSILTVAELPKLSLFLSSNKNISIFHNLLKKKDLEIDLLELIRQRESFTILAPQNEAFNQLFEEQQRWNSLDDIPLDQLLEILQYHLIPDKNIVLNQINENQALTSLNNGKITIQTERSKYLLKDSQGRVAGITYPDIQAINGIIHQIDLVLLPEENNN